MTASGLAASINDQRFQIVLQLNDSLPRPFMVILIAWMSLLFFGFGLLASVNRASVIGLAVGALSVAGAFFLISELSTPYSGLIMLSPAPIPKTIAVLGQ